MSNDEEILKELKKISKIMTLSNGSIIEKELEKYATSEDRKKIWVLIDGIKQSDDIAKIIGKTKRVVDIFLQTLEGVSLVERHYNKPPIRSIEYVPISWVALLENSNIIEKNKEETGDEKNDDSQFKEFSNKLDTITRLLSFDLIKNKPVMEQIRILTKAGLPVSEIATILGKKENQIYVTQTNLRKKWKQGEDKIE